MYKKRNRRRLLAYHKYILFRILFNSILLLIGINIFPLFQSDPYHWAWLPYAKHPFSDDIRQVVLTKLENMDFVQELVDDLYELFKVRYRTINRTNERLN